MLLEDCQCAKNEMQKCILIQVHVFQSSLSCLGLPFHLKNFSHVKTDESRAGSPGMTARSCTTEGDCQLFIPRYKCFAAHTDLEYVKFQSDSLFL